MWKVLVGEVAARVAAKEACECRPRYNSKTGYGALNLQEDKLHRLDKVRCFAVSCLTQTFETVKMNGNRRKIAGNPAEFKLFTGKGK